MKVLIDGVSYVPEVIVPEPPEPPEPSETTFNAATFFNEIRETLFWGTLSQSQVDGFNTLGPYLKYFFPWVMPRWIEKTAYCLATFQWETASTMQPIKEYGGASTRYAPWYGRGYVQLTWEDNYLKQQRKLPNMAIVQESSIPTQVHDDRELALNPDTSAVISIAGMRDGDFTGKKLSDYIDLEEVDYVGARKIVNGTDKAEEIAAMAVKYEDAIRCALT